MTPNPKLNSRTVCLALAVLLAATVFGQNGEERSGSSGRISRMLKEVGTVDKDKVFILNSGSAAVQFSLCGDTALVPLTQCKDTAAIWQRFELPANQGQFYSGASFIRLMTVKPSKKDTCCYRYRLTKATRYSIQWNGECWDLIKLTD